MVCVMDWLQIGATMCIDETVHNAPGMWLVVNATIGERVDCFTANFYLWNFPPSNICPMGADCNIKGPF